MEGGSTDSPFLRGIARKSLSYSKRVTLLYEYYQLLMKILVLTLTYREIEIKKPSTENARMKSF